MARTRSRALTAGIALLAALAVAVPTAVPAFAEDGGPYIVVSSASASYPHGTENVSFTVTIGAAPPACLVADYPFELNYEFGGTTPGGIVNDEGVRNGGHTVVGNSLVFTYLVGTVAGPADYMLFAYTEDPCLGGPSFGESAIIDIEASTAGTLISGTVYEQQVAGSTDPDDYVRREGVQLTLWTADTYDWVTVATTGPDGTFSLLAPFDDDYDEDTEYVLIAEYYEWEHAYYYVAGSSPASPSSPDSDVATVFTADAGTSYDFYAGRPPGVDPTHVDYLCYYGWDAVSQDVVTALVEWENVCGTDGTIVDAELTYTDDAFDGFGYVAFPATLGRVPDVDDIGLDYFATIDDADDVDFTSTPTGAVVRYRDEGATVRDDAGDLVQVDVEVELEIDGQWARWTVDVFVAGTTTPASDVTFYLVGALGSDDDTTWMGDDGVLVSWGGGLDEKPIVGHRQTGGEAWHVSDGSGDMSLRGHESLDYEVVLIDVCPDDVGLEDALAPVAAAAFGDEIGYLGEGCPTLPTWDFTAPAFQVDQAFDQTFTAPTQDPWDWSSGGYIQVEDVPAGLDVEVIDEWSHGVAPSVRIFGTPTTEGPYEFLLFLSDGLGSDVDLTVAGTVAPAGPYVYDGEDTLHGVVHVQQERGALTPGDYDVEEDVRVILLSLDYGTWWDEDYTDEDGAFSLTAPVEDPDDETHRFTILVEYAGQWYYYEDGASFGAPSTRYVDEATALRPIDFDGDESYDVYAGRDVGPSDTDLGKICNWTGEDWQDVRTATAYWYYLCLTDGSVYDAATAHADDALNGYGNVVFPGRLDRDPDPTSYRLDYFVTADEYTVTDTATGAVLTLVDRDVEAWDETENLVEVDVEITVEIVGSWARWQVDVYYAGSDILAEDVPFFVVGDLGSDGLTVWQSSPGRAVSWDEGDGDPLVGHRVSSFDSWTYAYGDDDVRVLATGELTYEVAVVDWCEGGAGDPMADLLATLDTAEFGSALAQLGGVCDPQATWDFPSPSFTVGVPFDQTFTAPTDGLWDWFSGGIVQSWDHPDGLSIDILDTNVAGTPPSLRIHGTPTTAGPYRFSVQLDDYYGHSVDFYVPGKVAPAPDPDDEFPTDDGAGEIDLDLDLQLGDQVEGGQVTVTADGLQEGAGFDLIVRSTPQTLAAGTVPLGGTVIRTVALPKLEAGWHSLTFTSTWANGKPAVGRVWFLVSSTGTLLQVSTTAPNLATTGGGVAGSLLLGSVTLLAGLGLVALRRRRGATA